jgi:hypothetical protein
VRECKAQGNRTPERLADDNAAPLQRRDALDHLREIVCQNRHRQGLVPQGVRRHAVRSRQRGDLAIEQVFGTVYARHEHDSNAGTFDRETRIVHVSH